MRMFKMMATSTISLCPVRMGAEGSVDCLWSAFILNAEMLGLGELTADVSKTAEPFFKLHGFYVVERPSWGNSPKRSHAQAAEVNPAEFQPYMHMIIGGRALHLRKKSSQRELFLNRC